MEKVGDNLLLQFSNFSFDRVPPDSEWSVRGELCSANHKKEEEEEEERSDGKLLRREPVLSRRYGLTINPTMTQVRRTGHVMTNNQMPPRNRRNGRNRKKNRNQKAKKSIKPITLKYENSLSPTKNQARRTPHVSANHHQPPYRYRSGGSVRLRTII